MAKTDGFLVDVDYESNSLGDSVISGFFRTPDGLEQFFFPEFKPYLFAASLNSNALEAIREKKFGPDGFSVLKIEETKKSGKTLMKLFFKSTKELVIARDELRNMGISIFEFDIEFIEEAGKKNMVSFKPKKEQHVFAPKMAAIDIETYSPGRFPTPQKDEILMICTALRDKSIVYTKHQKGSGLPGTKVFATEKEMLSGFFSDLREMDLDVLITYNGDSFDMPYLTERAKLFGLKADFGFDGSEIQLKRKGLENAAKLKGVQHVDAYQTISLLSRFGAVSLVKKDLESV